MMERTYRISDVVSEEFIRFPLYLLANPQYRELSLEAKFVYSLLLNRMTLSQKNGWINDDGEVFLIYTREDISQLLNISYKKTISAFKELIAVGLLFEERQGRGYPNLLYVLKAQLSDENADTFSEEYNRLPDGDASLENQASTQIYENDSSRTAKTAYQELSNQHIKNCQNDTSRNAETVYPEMPIRHTRNTENKYIDNSKIEINPSICRRAAPIDGGQTETDRMQLKRILDNCDLYLFRDNIRTMLTEAIERLYYSNTLRIGDAQLPLEAVRNTLLHLNYDVLTAAVNRLKNNETSVRNPTAYLMSVIFNGICEQESDLMLSLPPSCYPPEDIYEMEDYHVPE